MWCAPHGHSIFSFFLSSCSALQCDTWVCGRGDWRWKETWQAMMQHSTWDPRPQLPSYGAIWKSKQQLVEREVAAQQEIKTRSRKETQPVFLRCEQLLLPGSTLSSSTLPLSCCVLGRSGNCPGLARPWDLPHLPPQTHMHAYIYKRTYKQTCW